MCKKAHTHTQSTQSTHCATHVTTGLEVKKEQSHPEVRVFHANSYTNCDTNDPNVATFQPCVVFVSWTSLSVLSEGRPKTMFFLFFQNESDCLRCDEHVHRAVTHKLRWAEVEMDRFVHNLLARHRRKFFLGCVRNTLLQPVRRHKSSSPESFARGLLAGLTHEEAGVDFDEAYSLVQDLPQETLLEFEDQLWENAGKRIVYATKAVSVIDCYTDMTEQQTDIETGPAKVMSDVVTRSLYLNDRPDLVQSSTYVDRHTGAVLHQLPPPRHGDASTEVQGLALAVAIHSRHWPTSLLIPSSVCTQEQESESQGLLEDFRITITVLGAGACSLSAFFCAAPGLPPAGLLLTFLSKANVHVINA